MSPNDRCFFGDILPLSPSISSDSESLFEVDVKNSGNQTEHEWDIIERTLYQEPGPQVTDQELLKECKLWRDTFPHIRVTGTKVGVNKTDIYETDQRVQTIKNQFDLKKIEEKRQVIKKKIVGELVERLIAKFSLPKETEKKESTVQITEIDDEDDSEINCPKMIINFSPEKKINKEPIHDTVKEAVNIKKESYFERGKPEPKEIRESVGLTKKQAEKGLLNIFNSQGKIKDFKDYKNFPKLPEGKGNKPEFTDKHDFDLKSFDKEAIGRGKARPNILPSDSTTNMFKPFKMVSKIDKKYEDLLEKIMERKYKESNQFKHCPINSLGVEIKSCQDSLEKLSIESGFNFKKNLPKINKFNNNWLNRSEMNAYCRTEDMSLGRTNSIKNKKLSKEFDLFKEERSEADIDDFIEKVKKEINLNYNRQQVKSGAMEGMSFRKLKPYKPEKKMDRSVKSRSCGDLPKKEKKEAKSRQMKSGLEKPNESNFKSRSKLTNLSNNRGSKMSGNKSVALPPIESGIICTELTGRPKIGPKTLSKRL